MIRAGELRDLAVVQKHKGIVREGEATYGSDEDWEPFIPKLWVQLKSVSGGETIRGRQVHANATAIAKTYMTPETKQISETMRLAVDGRIFNILAAMDMDGDRTALTLHLAEQT